MTLAAGTRLGPYEVQAPLGAGGMGEVYRAKDTRLERVVALKVIPAHLSADPELKARLVREGRAISSLNHPHICALYDVGSEDGLDYLVMEYLEGETLADRLAKGPLPTELVLRFGVEIADALEKAHKQGIVHRDLKPANVMLTKSGVKLLDFGLAKLRETRVEPALSTLPTRLAPRPLTEKGTILGTFQYMSPEQLEGKDADARSDIFAFGAVLYEASTRRKAFSGASQASLIAAILTSEPPPISTIQRMSPPAVDRLVKTCLAKDPDDRWQSAHDVAAELRWIAEGGSQVGVPAPVVARRKSRERLAWSVSALSLGLVVFLVLMRGPRARTGPIRLSLDIPPKAPFRTALALTPSPDGSRIAFVGIPGDGKPSLYVRALSSLDAQEVGGTQGASFPFWSPDGRSLGFFADGKLKRVALAGGPPRVLADARDPSGGTWGKDDVILFTPDTLEAIWKIGAGGGTPVRVTKVSPKEEAHRYPAFLPDGRRFVFLADSSSTENHTIRLGSLDSLEAPILLQAVSNAAFALPDMLLYVRAHTLLAQRINLSAGKLLGEPLALADDVTSIGGNHRYGFGQGGDILVYQSASPDTRLVFIDRSGRRQGDVAEPGRWADIALSPDGTRVAAMRLDENERPESLFTIDLSRGSLSRLTTGGGDAYPTFSPDGSRVFFVSMRGGKFGDIYSVPADGGIETVVAESAQQKIPESVSPDGKTALVEIGPSNANPDIYLLDLASRKLSPFLVTPFAERAAKFSPDGRWVAYTSDESGRDEVYLRTVAGGARTQVSSHGGSSPKWRRDGRELFFLSKGAMLAADIMSPRLGAGEPRTLFALPRVGDFDVTENGQKFLFVLPAEESVTPRTTVVVGWREALGR